MQTASLIGESRRSCAQFINRLRCFGLRQRHRILHRSLDTASPDGTSAIDAVPVRPGARTAPVSIASISSARSTYSAVQWTFAEGITAVDEQSSARRQSGGNPALRLRLGVRVAAIQRTDTHGKGDIVGRFARLQLKVFDRRLTKAENA